MWTRGPPIVPSHRGRHFLGYRFTLRCVMDRSAQRSASGNAVLNNRDIQMDNRHSTLTLSAVVDNQSITDSIKDTRFITNSYICYPRFILVPPLLSLVLILLSCIYTFYQQTCYLLFIFYFSWNGLILSSLLSCLLTVQFFLCITISH